MPRSTAAPRASAACAHYRGSAAAGAHRYDMCVAIRSRLRARIHRWAASTLLSTELQHAGKHGADFL
jgi:hypothetical protein